MNPLRLNLSRTTLLLLLLLLVAAPRARAAEAPAFAQPAFADPDRRKGAEAVLPEIDTVFADLARKEHLPGLVYGVVMEGRLIHARGLGFANLEQRIEATPQTAFRIASMTKSFVTLAILRLRDEGRLSLDDPVARHLRELRRVRAPLADAPPITIRNLMTMTSGLPEDNPWGDRQMAITREALQRFVEGGLSFSNPPGQEYEYSNLGFVLLGQVIRKASGIPFQEYITRRILLPLGMTNTVWEFSRVPAGRFALGYRWEHDTWTREPVLHDGEGAACGGLITTLEDFAKYTAFHLGAWPARVDADTGPVRRATVRELHRPFVLSGPPMQGTLLDGTTPNPGVSFYGYGLGWSIDGRKVVSIGHTGGLPGYGSHFRFLPDHDVAVIAFANRTYAPARRGCVDAMNRLLEHGHLQPRGLVASAILATRARQVGEMIRTWDPRLAEEVVAENFFLDRSR
ncbi:MAG TPA: serine hydrolase, partial [Verrucomicrobiales bacterium]|nr:serine hydrolase [Verrucomicrobiales bacterium]